MSTCRENYESWFKGVVQLLHKDGNAGLAILMITIPLLERYLREKSGIYEGQLNDDFYSEFIVVFPQLTNPKHGAEVWHIFRNGLLHQVTLSRGKRNGDAMQPGWLSYDGPALFRDVSGVYCINPRKFADEIFRVIDSDFETFEGRNSVNHPMPIVINQFAQGSNPLGLSCGTSNAPC